MEGTVEHALELIIDRCFIYRSLAQVKQGREFLLIHSR